MKKAIKHLIFDTIILDCVFIVLLSLVTLNWVGPKEIIDGNDTGYPLNPIPFFQERLHQWRHNFGAGLEFSYGSAGVTWHGIQALIAKTGVDIFTNQKIFLLFWFNLITLSFYFLISVLLPDKSKRFARLTGTVFYAFNPYLFNLWSNIQSANLAAYVFIPFATGCLIKAFKDSGGYLRWVVLASLSSWLCSAMGGNPQVIFVVGLYLALFFLFIFIGSVVKLREIAGKKYFQTVALFTVFTLLLNLFWVVPEFGSITSDNLSLAIPSAGKLRGWLENLSLNTSVLNVLRMQGEWIWYDNYRGEPYVPFANFFKTSPILIILGFLAFTLSVISIYKSKNRWTVFFTLTLAMGLFLSLGTKAPFGYLYSFLTEKIKLFSFLRSPWYKFSLLTAISYSVLVAFFVDWFLTPKNIIKSVFVIFIIVGQLFYSFPLVTGEVVSKNFKILPPYRFSIPDYIWRADEWLRKDKEEFKVVVTPRQTERDFYYWGYGAPIQIGNLLANPKSFLNGSEWGVIGAAEANQLVDSFYRYLFRSSSNEVAKILAELNVKYILQKNDFIYDFGQSVGSPDFVREKISQQKYLGTPITIGQWDFYEIDDKLRKPLIFSSDRLNISDGDVPSLADIFLVNENPETVSVLTSDLQSESIKILDQTVKGDLFASGYLLQKDPNFWPINPFARFSPKHPAYLYTRWKEEEVLKKAVTQDEKILLNLFYATKRLGETEFLYKEGLSIPENEEILKKLIQDFDSKIKTVEENFNEMVGQISDKKSVELLQNIDLSLQIHQAKLVPIYEAIRKDNLDLKDFVYKAIEEVLNFQKRLKETLSKGLSVSSIKMFQVDIPEKGEYEIYLNSENINQMVFEKPIISLNIGGVQFNQKVKILENGWLTLGTLLLDEGKKIVEVAFPEPKNLVEGFGAISWLKQGKVEIRKEGQEEILILGSNDGSSSVSTKLTNLDLGQDYVVSFQYKTLSLNKPRFKISSPGNSLQFDGKIVYKRDGILDYSSDWKKIEVALEPDNAKGEMEVSFSLDKPPIWGEKGLAQIKSPRIYQETTPSLIFKKATIESGGSGFSLPKISFNQVNPTKYLVEVKNAKKDYILAFLESYHPLWQASLKTKSGNWLPIAKERHLKINGYANGWIIDQAGDYQIRLEYLPQRTYQYLLLVSVVSCLLGLGYLGVKLSKKSKND